MATVCYAQVRGSAVRVTKLSTCGGVTDPVRFATSRSVARVVIDEVTETDGHELLRNPEDEPRVRITRSGEMIRNLVSVDFLRVDPGVLSIVAGVRTVTNASGDLVGFDAETKTTAAAFALEVWSQLAGHECEDGTPQWGYTLFPFLKGGHLTGFTFANGLVSFNLTGAQTRKAPRWGAGPYDLAGPFQRLMDPVSRNTMFQNFITPATPPAQTDGVQTVLDVVDNGTAANPMPIPDAPVVLDGGTASDPGMGVVEGGRAA